MAVRVTSAEVFEIIDVISTITNLTPYITAANRIVEDNLTGKGIADGTLKEVERWLSAHFTAIHDQRFTKEKVELQEVSYGGKTGMRLLSTLYGQQAMILDPTGTLEKLNNGKYAMNFQFFPRD